MVEKSTRKFRSCTIVTIVLFIECSLLVSGCVIKNIPPPVEEYSIARAAIEAARYSQAPRLAHGHWSQADEAYRQGKLFFKEREYAKAKAAFLKAKISAEKAENTARVLRFKSGDIL